MQVASGTSTLATFQQVLSTLVLLITLGFLVAAIWTAYQRFSANAGEPSDPSKHRCRNCSTEFRCRNRAKPVKLDENGRVSNPGEKGGKRPTGVNSFERKTVYVGSFPIEVSNPTNKNCCSVLVQPGQPPERFCNYACYRARLKAIRDAS